MAQHAHFHISSLLNSDEWKLLRKFCNKCERLRATKLARESGGALRARIKLDVQKGLDSKCDLPPEEQIVEFLTAFRFFYLQKEETHFPRILNILGKYTTDSNNKTALKTLRKRWDDYLFRKTIEIKYNNTSITSSLLFDLWFNSHYFHSDEDKTQEMDKLKEGISEGFLKYMLLDAAYEATNVVFTLYNGVHDLVANHSSSNELK